MNTAIKTSLSRLATLSAATATFLTAPLQAQMTFSVEDDGPTIGATDAFGALPITAGDILTPATGPAAGPNPPALAAPMAPGIAISAGAGGLGLAMHGPCAGMGPASGCPIEVDALSYGLEFPIGEGVHAPGIWHFSVDEYAAGMPGLPMPPNVSSEGIFGVEFEASADVFTDLGWTAPLPLAPFAGAPGNGAKYDGDGLPNASGIAYPGVGVIEPNTPSASLPDAGDNVDAIDVDTALGFDGITHAYISLDAAWIDPLTGFPLNGSAAAHAFAPGDVLHVPLTSGGAPSVYAAAPLLGLDRFGVGTDDLDALIVWENGTGVYEPSLEHFDWVPGAVPLKDMLLFSVRRGSRVIGKPDSKFGIPIEEGDILSTPLSVAAGGNGNGYPSLFIAAENLGLMTLRSAPDISHADELDALDLSFDADCNGNGIPDALDIASGTSTDVNMDGTPDECQLIASSYCFCAASAPCGNTDSSAGCMNSSGSGALLTASGSGSVSADDLFLMAGPLPASQFGIFYMGTSAPLLPFGDGQRCVGGSVYRYPVTSSGPAGVLTFGPIVGYSVATFPSGGVISSFSSWNFQAWFRDPGGPCGFAFNLSNAMEITFTP